MADLQKVRVRFGLMDWKGDSPGLRSKSVDHNGTKMKLVEFSEPFFEKEWCIKGHIGCVLEGELDIEFENETMRYVEGDGLFIPAGMHHKAIVVPRRKALLILFENAN